MREQHAAEQAAEVQARARAATLEERCKSGNDVTLAMRMLVSTSFQVAMAIVIMANAVVIGFETDIPHVRVHGTDLWSAMENGFLALFVLEFGLKLYVQGWRELMCGPDYIWNVLDCAVIVLGLADTAFSVAVPGRVTQGGMSDMVRMVRMLRILRIFKLIRFLKQLYMLAVGFGLAVIAVFWLTLLMSFGLYVCSIVLVRTLGRLHGGDPELEDFLAARFGTIPTAMLTLFNLMLSPNLQEYEQILFEYPLFAFFMVGFTVFGSLGLIAVMTGVIMENMFQKNDVKKDEDRDEMCRNRDLLVKECQAMFADIPKEKDGLSVRLSDIEVILPEIGSLFKRQGVVFIAGDLSRMLNFMDVNATGTVTLDGFIYVVQQFVEGVQPMLIMELMHEVTSGRATLAAKIESVESRLNDMQANRHLGDGSAGAQGTEPREQKQDAKARRMSATTRASDSTHVCEALWGADFGSLNVCAALKGAQAGKLSREQTIEDSDREVIYRSGSRVTSRDLLANQKVLVSKHRESGPEALEELRSAILSEVLHANTQLRENIQVLGEHIQGWNLAMMHKQDALDAEAAEPPPKNVKVHASRHDQGHRPPIGPVRELGIARQSRNPGPATSSGGQQTSHPRDGCAGVFGQWPQASILERRTVQMMPADADSREARPRSCPPGSERRGGGGPLPAGGRRRHAMSERAGDFQCQPGLTTGGRSGDRWRAPVR